MTVSEEAQDLIAASGLFDAAWYRQGLSEHERNCANPVLHFLTEGTRRCVNPSPLFDSRSYLEQVWSLVPGVDNALLHYLAKGKKEGRFVTGVQDRVMWRDDGVTAPTCLTPILKDGPSVAVVIHAFHLDVLKKSLLPRLLDFPCPASFLITTDTAEKAAEAELWLRNALPGQRIYVRVAGNRGRNFGPLLCMWRQALLRHDLFLHIHTKKSLYTGREQVEWRDTLLDALLPTVEGISGILRHFHNNPELGVLQPSPGVTVPWWAWTWLKNRNIAFSFLEKFNISAPDGYFDFPAGGMFWARTQALKPLLDYPWSEKDFPEEAGQTDGTPAHAIERCVGVISRANGYRTDEYDRHAGLIRIGYGCKNLFLYEKDGKEAFLRGIAAAETVSFDLFDTLLTRTILAPDAVHRLIGERLSRHFPDLHPPGDGFFGLRRMSERMAREALLHTDDVTLTDIYAALSRLTGWADDALDFAKHEEVAIDLAVLRPRASVVEGLRLAKAAGKRTLVVSDTYLSLGDLRPVLEKTGIFQLVDEFYLSSERKARKDRGDMWDLLRATENVSGLLHVGDNEQADIQRAADLKIRHHHVMSGLNLLRLSAPGRFVLAALEPSPTMSASHAARRRLAGDVLLGPMVSTVFETPFLESAPAVCDRSSLTSPIVLNSPELAGKVLLGPLFLVFFARFVFHPALDGLERIFFLSREGYFLSRLYRRLRENWFSSLPVEQIFPVSRRVAIAAAQAERLDPDILLDTGDGYRGNMADLLRARLGLELPRDHALRDMMVVLPEDRDLTRSVTLLLRDEIMNTAKKTKDELQAWAVANGVSRENGKRSGVVDIGYGGTIQYYLQRALGRPFTGLYMAVETRAKRVEAEGGLAFGLLENGEKAVMFRKEYSIFLESVLTAPYGQTIGYDRSQTPPLPVFAPPGLSQTHFPILERIMAGVEAYMTDILESYGVGVLRTVQYGEQAAAAPLKALRAGALKLTPEIAETLFTEDAFCGRGEIRAMEAD